MKYSLTMAGLIATALGVGMKALGLDVVDEDIQKAAEGILIVGGFLVSWLGRWRQGDITVIGVKKEG